ncbi:MAG: glycosyltransferase [Chloroflexi bacterium]|nr:glycosyltransferase [Chloroflexota bacterium]
MTVLSVVIPAYNEAESIQAVMERVLAVRPRLTEVGVSDLELIVVDDGSRDRTAELVEATPGARLIRHRTNGGYGAALKTGFAAARGEWIGFLDADGTYPPESFPELCRVGLAQDADIVIGSRMAGAASEMPAVRRVGNFIFANLVSLVSAQRITDSASGMRVFKKSVLERIYPLPDGLNLTPVMSTRALHEGLKMIEVPIPYSERAGRSKLSVVRDGMRFAQSIVWTALTYNPVRQLGLIGLACLAVTLAVALWIVVQRVQGITTLSPWGIFALFTAAVLGVAGVSIFLLGVMFNYLVAIFYKRPIRQGLFGPSLFRSPLDRHFWWLGLLALLTGILLAVASLALSLRGWPADRLWFWQLGAAMNAIIGVQLIIGWFIMRVLEELSQREARVAGDMRANGQGSGGRDQESAHP